MPIAVTALVLLAGCAGPGQGDAGPIRLSTELSDRALSPGEYTNLTVTVENTGEEPYTYEHPGCPPEAIRAEVATGDEPIRLYPYGKEPAYGACAVREVTLEPGQTVEAIVNWNGHEGPAQPEPHDGSRVSPGEYTIDVHLARADGGPTFAEQVTVEVRS